VSEKTMWDRRHFIGSAAMTIAGAQVALSSSYKATARSFRIFVATAARVFFPATRLATDNNR